MPGTLLLTGATGALGVPLLAEILRARSFDRVIAVVRAESTDLPAAIHREAPGLDLSALTTFPADLGQADAGPALAGLPSQIDCVLHAAACTKFRAPAEVLVRANIDATRHVLRWAESLGPRTRLIHFSTTCVAGERTGLIPEAPLPRPAGFVNDYERTKWEAEQLVASSPLRPEIVRLATVVGSRADGHLGRPGAFHSTLRWLHGGLLPLVPGDQSTRLDLLPTELVTGFFVRLLARPPEPGAVFQVSCGACGVPLGELLEFAAARFGGRSPAWKSGQILPPVLASREAFEEFRATIRKTRDFLFLQVMESVDSFLPELFHPKQCNTARAETVWGGPLPLPEWRDWIGRVIDYALDTDFGRREIVAAKP